jgi:NAD(P)-dependent dehydrogenase (short-subunit alcohol dehydrogenase family)
MSSNGSGDDLFDLGGVRAVVTGAARGIGRSAALALAKRGADVVLFDILEDDLKTTDELVRETGGMSTVHVGDVTSVEDVRSLVERSSTGMKQTVVVNCAGVVRRSEISAMTLSDLDYLWNVNVRGTVGVTQAFLPQMMADHSGKVINVGSLGSVVGLDHRTAYATTKGGVALFTKSLALEVGRYGICVNAIAPGYLQTDMTSDWLFGNEQRTSELLSRIPLGRFGTTADVDGMVIFLASRASDYVTGQVLMLDGGWTTS